MQTKILELLNNPSLLTQTAQGDGLSISDLSNYLEKPALALKNPLNDLLRAGYVQHFQAGNTWGYKITHAGKAQIANKVAA